MRHHYASRHRSLLTAAITLSTLSAMSQADGIYVSDAGNFNAPPWQILRFDPDGSNPVAFITDQLNWPQDILFLEDSNRVLISNLGTGRITKYDATTGAYISNFATGIAGPTRTRIGPDGLLYVLQWNGVGLVRRYELNGSYLGTFTTVGVSQSIGLDWDAAGNLYVSSYNSGHVRKFDPSGADLGIFIGSNLVGPTNIWFDTNGDLLVADYGGGAVKRFDPDGNYLGPFITGVGQTEGVAHYPAGSFLLGDGASSSVKMFQADGTFVQDIVPSGSGGLITPNAVVIRGEGPTAIAEHASLAQPLFTPALGDTFQLVGVHLDRLRTITIYGPKGAVVHTGHTTLWDAREQAAGNYVAVAEWADGRKHAQRLVVAH